MVCVPDMQPGPDAAAYAVVKLPETRGEGEREKKKQIVGNRPEEGFQCVLRWNICMKPRGDLPLSLLPLVSRPRIQWPVEACRLHGAWLSESVLAVKPAYALASRLLTALLEFCLVPFPPSRASRLL